MLELWMSRVRTSMTNKNHAPRISKQSEKRIETALKTGDLSQLTDQELCQAWLEAYSGFSDARLLAIADNIPLHTASGRLRARARRAGLSLDEVDAVAAGRIERISDESLDKLIAVTEK